MEFYKNELLTSPDAREKPRIFFFASFGKAAGKWITENARMIRSKKKVQLASNLFTTNLNLLT
jgi:hypothetical protein